MGPLEVGGQQIKQLQLNGYLNGSFRKLFFKEVTECSLERPNIRV